MQLLERASSQFEMSLLLDEAAVGQGRLLLVGGEAGIGKTSLVRGFSQISRTRARLLFGSCDPLSTPIPLGPLLDMQPALSGRFAEQLSGAADRNVVVRVFLAELVSSPQPLVVVFEDVHWADEATLDLLRFLGRRLDGVPALVIATYRSEEVGDRHPLRLVMGDLATVPAVRRLRLEPLSLAGVRTLCAGTALNPVRLHAQTGGNPFFVTEVIASGGTGIPATVRDAVLARANRLPGPTRAALDAAAVLGFRFEPELWETVAQSPPEAVDALLEGGMIRASGDHFHFHHELVREALLEVLPPHRRLKLHRRALAVLRSMPDGVVDPGRLAHHAEGAGDRGMVLEYAPQAARRARELSAHREAVSQFARALACSDGLPADQRAQLWEEYSWECVAADQWTEATRAGRECVAIWRAEGDCLREGKALCFLVGCLSSTGEMTEAESAIRASIALLETLAPGDELAEAHGMDAYLQTLRHNTAGAMDSALRLLDLVEPGGTPYLMNMGYSMLGTARVLHGISDGEWYLERALGIAREAGLHWSTAAAYFNIGTAWARRYEFALADRCLTEGLKFAVDHELDGWETNILCWVGVVQLYLGRWREAEASSIRVASHTPACTTSRIIALQVLGRLYSRQGNVAAAAILDEATALAVPTTTLLYLGPVQAARAEASMLAGDLRSARDEAAGALDLAIDNRDPWLAGELLFLTAASGESVERPNWIAPPFAFQLAGSWLEAAAAWKRRGCPYESAQALAGTQEPEHLLTALAEFDRLGARPAAEHTLRRLRALGVRGIPRGPRPSTTANPGGLTRREAEIARLLAEGLQNTAIARRLFLSPKTVGHHVSAVLAKLRVPNRAEAAREVARLGLLQDRESEAAR
jgi:DNA-binding CsgD family transcriptional regulator/tetratricopeptide (TPR) repeat protein